jgi:hypothetical protein
MLRIEIGRPRCLAGASVSDVAGLRRFPETNEASAPPLYPTIDPGRSPECADLEMWSGIFEIMDQWGATASDRQGVGRVNGASTI